MAYQMPPVDKGEIVLHFQDKGGASSPAMVTAVGREAVSLTIWPEMYRTGSTRDGVRHASDPNLKKDDAVGFWDYTPLGRLLRELVAPPQEPIFK